MNVSMDAMHPGEMLDELYLKPLGMMPGRLADSIFVQHSIIEGLVAGSLNLSPDLAARLAKFFNTSIDFWVNMQSEWDIEHARKTIDVSAIRSVELTKEQISGEDDRAPVNTRFDWPEPAGGARCPAT